MRRIFFVLACVTLFFSKSAYAQMGGGNPVTGNDYENWIDSATFDQIGSDPFKGIGGGLANYDLDTGSNLLSATVEFYAGSEVKTKTFSGQDDGDLAKTDDNVAQLACGFSLSCGLTPFDSFSLPLANEKQVTFSKGRYISTSGMAGKFDVKVRTIVENNGVGFKKVKVYVVDGANVEHKIGPTIQTTFDEQTTAQTTKATAVNGAWRIGSPAYFKIRVKLFEVDGTTQVGTVDEGTARKSD